MPNAFDAWFEDSQTCDIENGHCATHNSEAALDETYCVYRIEDPLNDPYDAMVEDELVDSETDLA